MKKLAFYSICFYSLILNAGDKIKAAEHKDHPRHITTKRSKKRNALKQILLKQSLPRSESRDALYLCAFPHTIQSSGQTFVTWDTGEFVYQLVSIY